MNIAGLNTTTVKRKVVDSTDSVESDVLSGLDTVHFTPSEVSDEDMMRILNIYYKHLGITVNWNYTDCILGAGGGTVTYTYTELIDRNSIWGVEHYPHRYATMHAITVALDKALEALGVVLPSFRFRPHQIGEGERLWALLEEYGWGMLRHLPRTGKTGTVLYALEHSPKPLNILIVTTKNALRGIGSKRAPDTGWAGFISMAKSGGWCSKHTYELTTPHRLHKVDESIVWDIVLLDESHKIYSDPKPKPSSYWAMAKYVVGEAKVVYITATPHSQSINQLFWQLALCKYTPWSKLNWQWAEYFAMYGISKTVLVGNGVMIPVWTEGKVDEVYRAVGFGILSLSQEDVGFKAEMLPTDVPCYVEMSDATKAMMKEYRDKEYMRVGDVMVHSMNTSDVPMRLHQIEGSTLKYVDVFSVTDSDTGVRFRGVKPITYNWFLQGREKIAYIKERWGDVESVVIMYHYVNEGKLLRREFKNAKIMQGITNAEGIDLYMYDTMVIYSMNFSVATYIQRRDRQVSLTRRDKPINVYYLLVKGGISADIYESVVQKGEDLTMNFYEKSIREIVNDED